MAPRAYRLGKRAETTEETRRRIIEAVVRLHSENGILATTYEAIAEAADVVPATVYRHFPTLDELVPACGNRILEVTHPPGPAVLEGKLSKRDRVEVFVREIFAFWERARPYYEKAMGEADRVPALARGLEAQAAQVGQLARMALGGQAAAGEHLRLLLALTDFRVWCALDDRGLGTEAPRLVSDMVIRNTSRSKARKQKED